MLERLKLIDLARMDMDEAMALAAFGRGLQHEYAEFEIEPPAWLHSRLRELQREIRARHMDGLEKRLRDLKRMRESLEEPAAKREKMDAEIKKLENAISA